MRSWTAEFLLDRFLFLFSVCIAIASICVPFVYEKIQPGWTGIGVLIWFLLIVLGKQCMKKEESSRNRILHMGMLVHCVLMVGIVCTVHLRPVVDLKDPICQIEEMIQENTREITQSHFSVYPNNIPLTILLYRIYSLVRSVFGTSVSLEQTGGLLNVLMIETTIICLFRLIDCADRTPVSGWAVKWIVLLNPAWIAYAAYYYTDTVSLPFAAAGLLVFVYGLQEEQTGKRMALWLLSGLLLGTAMKIRVTSLLLILSILIALLYRKRFKEFRTVCLLFALALGTVHAAYSIVEDSYVTMDTYDTAVPATHFLMMGSHGNGKYDREDFQFTTSFSTHEEKVQQTWNAYLNNLRHNGIKGNIILVIKKEVIVWCNGTHGYELYTSRAVKESWLYHLLYGNHSAWFKGLMQGYRILLFAGIAYGLWKYRRGMDDLFLLCMVYWCSTIMFSAVWEAHTRHSLSYIPFLTLLCLPAFQKNNV